MERTPAGADRPEGADRESRPRIDVSPALHDAGHEVEELGYADLPDSGPVVHPEQGHVPPEDPLDFVNVQLPSD